MGNSSQLKTLNSLRKPSFPNTFDIGTSTVSYVSSICMDSTKAVRSQQKIFSAIPSFKRIDSTSFHYLEICYAKSVGSQSTTKMKPLRSPTMKKDLRRKLLFTISLPLKSRNSNSQVSLPLCSSLRLTLTKNLHHPSKVSSPKASLWTSILKQLFAFAPIQTFQLKKKMILMTT